MIFKWRFSCALPMLMALVLLSGCAGFRVGEEVQTGRRNLLLGRPQLALISFQRAARRNPHYVTDFTEFDEGIWTYVGRAHYRMGELRKARGAFGRALAENRGDHLAHLYLGMTMMAQGEKERGFREVSVGLRSLKRWLADMDRYDASGVYWDPGFILEGEIDNLMLLIRSGDVSWIRIVRVLESLGIEFEEEIDRALEDEWDAQDSGEDNPS